MYNFLVFVAVVVAIIIIWWKLSPTSFKACINKLELWGKQEEERQRNEKIARHVQANNYFVVEVVFNALIEKRKYLSLYDLPSTLEECLKRLKPSFQNNTVISTLTLTSIHANAEILTDNLKCSLLGIFENYFCSIKKYVYLLDIKVLDADGKNIQLIFMWNECNDLEKYHRMKYQPSPSRSIQVQVPDDEDFPND